VGVEKLRDWTDLVWAFRSDTKLSLLF